jgi:hypothetical protein
VRRCLPQYGYWFLGVQLATFEVVLSRFCQACLLAAALASSLQALYLLISLWYNHGGVFVVAGLNW